MKRYKLLKDTPTASAGTICETAGFEGHIITGPYGVEYGIAKIDDFDEWFEEVKELINGVHWQPEIEEDYWFINEIDKSYKISLSYWLNDTIDNARYNIGNIYRTKQEAEKAYNLQIARTKIRRSSDFVPDWGDGNQPKWYIVHDYCSGKLCAICVYSVDNGSIAYYETEKYAKQTMKDLEPEYLLHFGVEKGAI